MKLANMAYNSLVCIAACLVLGLHSANAHHNGDEDIYIVHVNPFTAPNGVSGEYYTRYYQWFVSDISAAAAAGEPSPSPIIYSYRHVLCGFAAKLTPEMVTKMSGKKGFVSATPQKVYHLHTTHSPHFLGLLQNFGFWQNSSYGKGVVVGVLDTGITPTHPSFGDQGMPPPPTNWKGKCEFKGNETCNNKLIGARFFLNGSSSHQTPNDEDGHGTHTSSTAAGNFVKDAAVFGSAKGTAVGIAPLAHVAMYKVCSELGCADTDILAAMDAAIDDGVDVLSISLAGSNPDFFEDGLAIGAFAAMKKGIFVSCSAGNDGPDHQTLSNGAPWLLTVGASTMDRTIKSTVLLGNKVELEGESAFQVKAFSTTLLPLVYPGSKNETAAFCGEGSFKETDVRGKVVLCEGGGGVGRVDKGQIVKDAGGAAMILVNEQKDGYSILADTHVLPATELSYNDGLRLKAYINSTSAPTATIAFKGTFIGTKNAPLVASFSSRGPNTPSPGILKPDIIGPGVNILAAWPVSVENTTSSKPTFNMISGTSMSCPHLSGIAALIKSSHPDWSPAAIKSAIMTTAYQHNLNGSNILDERLAPADMFATGAGHVNPSKADDPGLVYDMKPEDYIPYLCGLSYTDKQVQTIVGAKVNCSKVNTIPEAQLNYPSFSIQVAKTSLTYSRTVTNVGEANSEYTAHITPISGVNVKVSPKTLIFSKVNQQLNYNITFSRTSKPLNNVTTLQGAISWVSKKHIVRSPIVVALGLASVVNNDEVAVGVE